MKAGYAWVPVLSEVLEHLRADDTLIIWKLDRLGRSLKRSLRKL
jgi:DNA invertase Pin-like site-specific DNA recombinase